MLLRHQGGSTPPPWDPGHLVLGMELDAEFRSSLGIATPKPGDCQLITVPRIAVPRARELRAFAAANIVQHGHRDGALRYVGAAVIAAAVAALDRHRASEGSGKAPSEAAFHASSTWTRIRHLESTAKATPRSGTAS